MAKDKKRAASKAADSANVVMFPPKGIEDQVKSMLDELAGWQPPTNEKWCEMVNPLMPTTRLAWLTALKSKAEMREMVKKLNDDPDLVKHLLGHMNHASVFFESLWRVCAVGEARLLAYGAKR